jgi:hypothetical protein
MSTATGQIYQSEFIVSILDIAFKGAHLPREHYESIFSIEKVISIVPYEGEKKTIITYFQFFVKSYQKISDFITCLYRIGCSFSRGTFASQTL